MIYASLIEIKCSAWLNYFFGLFFLRTVFTAALFTVFHTGGIEASANDMVTNTRQIFNPSATDQHDGVLLQVMTFTRDVGDHLDLVCQADLGYFTQGGVWFLGVVVYTLVPNTTALRTTVQGPGFALRFDNSLLF